MVKLNGVVVFLDTSFFKAILDERDDFYKAALKTWKILQDEGALLATSNFILDEVFTLVRKRRGVGKVQELREFIIENAASIKIIRVTATDEGKAWDWFLRDWSDLSFTDCVTFALMKRMDLKRVATFDKHFARAGFESL